MADTQLYNTSGINSILKLLNFDLNKTIPTKIFHPGNFIKSNLWAKPVG